jgi:hypothetical protein
MSFNFSANVKTIALCLGLATTAICTAANAADPPKPCSGTNNRDPEIKDVYTGTSEVRSNGGGDRVGWQCFLHNTAELIDAELVIKDAFGQQAPYAFVSVQFDRETLPGFTMVNFDFIPDCKPYCTVYVPGTLTGTYTVRFRPQKK